MVDLTCTLRDNPLGSAGGKRLADEKEQVAPPPAPPTTLGGFEIVEKIGVGGMGAVYKAKQLSVDRFVALKILPPKFAQDAKFVKRFLREGRTAARLDHPNVVHAIDAGQAEGHYYYAMELVDGQNLQQVLKAQGRLPEQKALEYIRDVAAALERAHRAGLIHRDIKPANILITHEGTVKLADLGLARETKPSDGSITQSGKAIGTPHYISPEQIRGVPNLDGRCDIYSLGATLYHLMAGEPPFAGGTANEVMAKHLNDPLPNPKWHVPELSDNAIAIMTRAMAKDRDKRYSSAREMFEDIKSVLSGEDPAFALKPPRPVRRWKKPAIAAGIVFILGASGFLFHIMFIGKKEPPPPPPAAQPPVAVKPPEPVPPPDVPTTPPKPAEPTPREIDRKALAQLTLWANTEASNLRQKIERYTQTIGAMTDPDVKAKAQAELDRMHGEYSAAAQNVLKAMQDKAVACARDKDYDGAVAAFANVPEEYAPALAEQARAAADSFSREAEARIRSIVAQADGLTKSGNPADAIAVLDHNQYCYAPLDGEVKAGRERAEAEAKHLEQADRERKIAEAEKALDALLDKLDAAAERGDMNAVIEAEHYAERDAVFEPVADRLAQVLTLAKLLPEVAKKPGLLARNLLSELRGMNVSVETSLGVYRGKLRDVTRTQIVLEKSGSGGRVDEQAIPLSDLTPACRRQLRLEWSPSGADEALAAAVLALGDRNIESAEAYLTAAGNHPLANRYQAKLRVVRASAGEALAKKFWDERVRPFTSVSQFSDQSAAEAEQAIKQFRDKYGDTEFARSVTIDLNLLSNRAVAVTGKKLALQVQELFRGRIDEFDPRTLRIRLVYDFNGPDQLDDFVHAANDGIVQVEHGKLRIARAAMPIVTKARFRAASVSAEFIVAGGSYRASLVACDDGQGNRYEFTGIAKSDDEPAWESRLAKYVNGNIDENDWAPQPSPSAGSKAGKIIFVRSGDRLKGQIDNLVIEQRDAAFKSGGVGMWAAGTENAIFDDFEINGLLDRNWLDSQIKQ